MRLAGLAEQFFHAGGIMPRQAHGAVRQDLHPLIASQGLEVSEIKLEAAVLYRDGLADLLAVCVLAVGSQAHDLAFIAILVVADEFADHRVEAAEGVGEEHAVEHFDVVALATRHHGGDEVAGTVVAQPGGLLPRRTVVSAGDVGDVVFEVMLLKAKFRGINFESRREQRAHVAHGFLALAEANEVQNLGGVGQRVLNFLCQIRIAVLPDGHVVDVSNLRADRIQALFDRERGETAEMFVTVQTLLSNSEFDFAIEHDRRRGVGMKHVKAQNEHELAITPMMSGLGLVHSFRLACFMPWPLVWGLIPTRTSALLRREMSASRAQESGTAKAASTNPGVRCAAR